MGERVVCVRPHLPPLSPQIRTLSSTQSPLGRSPKVCGCLLNKAIVHLGPERKPSLDLGTRTTRHSPGETEDSIWIPQLFQAGHVSCNLGQEGRQQGEGNLRALSSSLRTSQRVCSSPCPSAAQTAWSQEHPTDRQQMLPCVLSHLLALLFHLSKVSLSLLLRPSGWTFPWKNLNT